jgi:signal peptidase complex subunit 1
MRKFSLEPKLMSRSSSSQAVAFIVGYALQDIKLALFITLGGTALTFFIVVPAWPFYNKHPLKWLPVKGAGPAAVPQNIVIDEKALG